MHGRMEWGNSIYNSKFTNRRELVNTIDLSKETSLIKEITAKNHMQLKSEKTIHI